MSEQSPPPASPAAASERRRSSADPPYDPTGEHFGRRGMLVVLVAVSVLFVYLVRVFLVPVILAAVFANLVFPLNLQLRRTFRDRRGLAALISCLAMVVGVLVPFYIAATFVREQAGGLYAAARPGIAEFVAGLDTLAADLDQMARTAPGPLAQILRLLPVDQSAWDAQLREIAATGGGFLATLITNMSRGTVELIANIFIILFTMFYFFRDGEAIVARIRALSPLDSHYEELLIERFSWVSRATLRGQAILASIQASIGVVTLWICGVQAPLLWGIVMVTVSIIPLVGTWLVMYPLALVQLLTGHTWQGIVIMVVTAGVISNIDNFIRPRLVGQRARMHDLLVFFSTLGGLYVYGVVGFIVGPIIAALFLAILDIYALEFGTQLARPAAVRRRASD